MLEIVAHAPHKSGVRDDVVIPAWELLSIGCWLQSTSQAIGATRMQISVKCILVSYEPRMGKMAGFTTHPPFGGVMWRELLAHVPDHEAPYDLLKGVQA